MSRIGIALFTALACSVSASAGRIPAAAARVAGGSPVALVTAERENEVVAVSLPAGKVLRRVRIHDPQTIAATVAGPAVVVSPSGTVTILAWRSLRVLAVLRGFRSPQIAAITPDRECAYVTDAATGELSVVSLSQRRVVDRVFVGYGAHHLAISSNGQSTWVALGERATTIVVLDSGRPEQPRVVGRIDPRLPAHDLAFAPDGRTVWVTSDTASAVSVLDARNGRLVGTVPAGPPPQHLVFVAYGGSRAYISSGYGSSLELVDGRTRRIVKRVEVPYGSFNLASTGDLIATASLLDGEVSEFAGPTLAHWLTAKVASETRDLAISVW
jgi:DNA-binding beta-propeller fold protein YncE